ncbi:partial, partial [Paramuricea clavata]
VSTYDVSAFAVLNDYETKSEIVTLQPNSLQAPFLVAIREDNIVENTEQFGVRVTSTDPQVNVVNGNLQVSITDNDKITLTMDSNTYQVGEDDGFVSVRVVVTGQTAVDIAGSRLSTNSLTAQSPSDYGTIAQTILVTPSSSTPLTFTITIQNDATIESNEFFQAVLSTTNTDQVNIGTPSSSSITILDDDALFISFEQPNYIVSEDDGTITVGVTVTGSTALTLEFG